MKDTPIMVKMDKEMSDWLRAYAKARYRSASQVIRDLVLELKDAEDRWQSVKIENSRE